ncbi:MAG: HNH endonuclease [Varibaculum timonense]
MIALKVCVSDLSESISPSGLPWWQVGGTTKRIAAYLWFNVELDGLFTMAEVRKAAKIEQQTQSDRRMRELREQGWVVTGYKDEKDLPRDSYRLKARGKRLWLGERIERDSISNKLRRQVFARDHNTCVICGVVAGEPYPDLPSVKARMTVGHRIPNQRLGTATLDNVQTECARCNETIRNLLEDPETFDSLKPLLDALSQDELRELNSWISDGKRRLSNLDLAYSKYHALNELGREQANAYIAALVIN